LYSSGWSRSSARHARKSLTRLSEGSYKVVVVRIRIRIRVRIRIKIKIRIRIRVRVRIRIRIRIRVRVTGKVVRMRIPA